MYNYLSILILLTFSFSTKLTFVSCEGNFGSGNGSLSIIDENGNLEHLENIGDVVQSITVHENTLFVILNGTNKILVYDIDENGITLNTEIATDWSGPRELIVANGLGYFTNWYSADVKIVDLDSFEIIGSIEMPGLPEDIEFDGQHLWVSIMINADWTDASTVVKIDTATNQIILSFEVGSGPNQMIVENGDVYISRTWYDINWNAFYGTTKISDGSVDINTYGSGMACGGDIMKYNNKVYRSFDGGVAQLDEELNIVESSRIGDYGFLNVYSVEAIDDHIYLGLSDYAFPDFVAVINTSGEEVAYYEVGGLPGDFAKWTSCSHNGDITNDGVLNVIDIVEIIHLIINEDVYNCSADANDDGSLNILDVIQLVQDILNTSQRGAVNWIRLNFPELQVEERLKTILANKHQTK